MLEALDKGDRSRLEVAASFSIAMPTLLRILRTRESIVQLGLSEGERTRIRQPTYAEVHNRRLELFFPCIALTHNPFVPLQIEEQLLVWINEQNSEGTKVSGKMIKEKASEIAIQMEIFNFPASNGWLDNFRRRYGFSKTNELSAEMQSRMGDIILSYEPDHGSPILLPKKRKVESQPREGKSVAKCFYSLSLPPTHHLTPFHLLVTMYVPKSASQRKTISRDTEIIHMVEDHQAHEEEVVLLDQPYKEEAEYTREDAREAHQILIAYFHANPPPPGTFLSLQRIGEAIGDDPEVEEATELVEGEEALIEEDDNGSIEVEIDESYLV